MREGISGLILGMFLLLFKEVFLTQIIHDICVNLSVKWKIRRPPLWTHPHENHRATPVCNLRVITARYISFALINVIGTDAKICRLTRFRIKFGKVSEVYPYEIVEEDT